MIKQDTIKGTLHLSGSISLLPWFTIEIQDPRRIPIRGRLHRPCKGSGEIRVEIYDSSDVVVELLDQNNIPGEIVGDF